jgi:hypothetical protein
MSGSGSSYIYSPVKVYNHLLNLHLPHGHNLSVITWGVLFLPGAGSNAMLEKCRLFKSLRPLFRSLNHSSGLETLYLVPTACSFSMPVCVD